MTRIGHTMRIVLYNNAETRRRETYTNAIWKDATPKIHFPTSVRFSVTPAKRSTWWQEYRGLKLQGEWLTEGDE